MNIGLVTGATGMLGSYMAGQLERDGWRVRGLVRDPERARWLADSGVELVHGDVLDAGALERAAEGCAAVFHCAAVIGPYGANAAGRRVNVEGTANVATAATRARARLVHVSSTSVYSHATRFRSPPTDESVTLGPLADDDWYGRSKLDAERVVLDATARGELWATIIRPPIMYGIRDRQFASRLAPALQRGVMPLTSGGRSLMTIVHAGSVAQGAVLALGTDKANGRVYNLANDTPVTVADFMRLAAAGLGVHVRMPSVPFAVARAATVALAGALTLAGRGNLAPHALGLIDTLARDNPFSSARARAELGWNPMVNPSVAIPEAFRWWRDHHRRRD